MLIKEENQQEFIDALQEVTRTLGYVVFVSIHDHPNPETVKQITNTLDRARNCLSLTNKRGEI